MNGAADSLGIIIISHGSPRVEANLGFISLVGRVASRLGMADDVLPAFFGTNRRPNLNIPVQLEELAGRGVRRVLLLPYFLYTGHHVTVDLPAALEECRRRFPQVALEMMTTLENEPMEDMLVERLAPLAAGGAASSGDGRAIERRSYEIIDRQLGGGQSFAEGQREIVRRVVHATADISFARTLRFHAEALQRGRAALAAGKPIICDVKMLQAGLTKVRSEVLCAVDQETAAARAEEKGSTRAAAGMELLAPRWEGAVVAIGNAPTALWKLLELTSQGGPRPALVVGLPVGFVGAAESKLALLKSDLCYVTNTGPRGGSPVAAAAVNALAMLGKEE